MKLSKNHLVVPLFLFLFSSLLTTEVFPQNSNVVVSNNQDKNVNSSNTSSNKPSDSNQNSSEQISNTNQTNSNANTASEKETVRKLELTNKDLGSIKLEGFDSWVYYVLIFLFIVFVAVSLWLAKKAAENGFKLWMILPFIGFAILMFFVGRLYDRHNTSLESAQKITAVEERAINNLPPSPPISPSGLTASPISDFQIKLSWADNDINENGFEIIRKLGADGKFVPLAKVGPNATNFVDEGLAPETTVSYSVRAFNTQSDGKLNYSGLSNEVTTITLPRITANEYNWTNPSSIFWYILLPILSTIILSIFVVRFLNYIISRRTYSREYVDRLRAQRDDLESELRRRSFS